MRYRGAPLLALTLACGPAPSPGMEAASREFAALARTELEDRAEIASLHKQATDLRLRADAVVTVWRASEQDFRQATDAYEAATAAGPAVNAQFQAAIADFQHAERRYRLTVLLVAAVAGAARALQRRPAPRHYCSPRMQNCTVGVGLPVKMLLSLPKKSTLAIVPLD